MALSAVDALAVGDSILVVAGDVVVRSVAQLHGALAVALERHRATRKATSSKTGLLLHAIGEGD